MDALERLLNNRHSCRGFTTTPVPRSTLERLFTVAGRTPSWCNTQAWEVVVTSGTATDELREAMAADTERFAPDFAFPASYEGVYRERRRESGWQLYEAVGVARGDREASAAQTMRNFDFFGAPHVAIVTTSASLGTYGAVDCGLYVQTLLLAAQALGLGAVAQAAIASRAEVVREHLGLDPDRNVVCAVSLGYADTSHPANSYRTSRAPLDETVAFHGSVD